MMSLLSFVSLCFFTFSNIFSINMYFGVVQFSFPQVFASIAIVFFCIGVLVGEVDWQVIINKGNFFILIFLVMAICLSYRGVDIQTSQEIIYGKFIKGVVVYLLVACTVTSLTRFTVYVNTILAATYLVSYWVTHYATYNNGRPYINISFIGSDPNYVGLFLAICVPLVVGMATYSKPIFIKFIYLIFLYFYLLGIVVTLSRGAFLALAFGVLYTIIKIRSRKLIIFYALSSIVVIPVALHYVSDGYVNRMLNIGDLKADQTGSSGQRSKNMLIGLNYIITHPVSEYGPGNNGYLIADVEGRTRDDYTIFHGEHIHCNILQIGADLGLIAMVMYLFFIINIYIFLNKSEKTLNMISVVREKRILVFAYALKASFVVFVVGAFFLPIAYDFHVFYIGGLCVALGKLNNNYAESIG